MDAGHLVNAKPGNCWVPETCSRDAMIDPDEGSPWVLIRGIGRVESHESFTHIFTHHRLASLTAGIIIFCIFELRSLSSERESDLSETTQLIGAHLLTAGPWGRVSPPGEGVVGGP